MFENPDILQSINIAKWHIWLACVSDLTLYAGQCMYRSGKLDEEAVRQLLAGALQLVLDETGDPDEAGADFASARDKMLQRVASCDWAQEREDEALFSQSPDALFYWSPIADELKRRDETIVKNSIRFRWIEVRRSTQLKLDFDALAHRDAKSQRRIATQPSANRGLAQRTQQRLHQCRQALQLLAIRVKISWIQPAFKCPARSWPFTIQHRIPGGIAIAPLVNGRLPKDTLEQKPEPGSGNARGLI
jgi:hypothetical protein